MTDDDPIDLTALLPTGDARINAIVRDALAARASRRNGGLFAGLAAWSRPALAAAAVIAAIALPTLLRLGVPRAPTPARTDTVAASLGIPEPLSQWARSGYEPSTSELLNVIGGPEWRTSQ